MPGDLPSSVLEPRRILVRGVNWLGDAVMTTPALQRLRERFPQAHITLLTPEKLAELWLEHPAIDEVVTFGPGSSLWSVAAKLRAGQRLQGTSRGAARRFGAWGWQMAPFDLALVLPNSPRSAVEVWLARVPRRFGYARPWRNCFLTHSVPPRPGRVLLRKRSIGEIKRLTRQPAPDALHAARSTQHASAHQLNDYLHLVGALGANAEPLPPQLRVTPDEVRAAAAKFGLSGASTESRPILGLNPGAEYGPAKRWPVERFVAAAREILRRTGCLWVILGGTADLPLARTIHSALAPPSSPPAPRPSALNLAGQTSLRELMAVLKLCRLLLTNDTGPMHLAAALDTPVVVPFGSTEPALTGPGLPGDPRHQLLWSDAVCSPCFRRACPVDFRCMTGITVERVVEAVMRSV